MLLFHRFRGGKGRVGSLTNGHMVSDSPKLGEEEATPMAGKEVMPGTLRKSFYDCNGVLGTLEPQEEATFSKLRDDMEGLNNVLVDFVEDGKD